MRLRFRTTALGLVLAFILAAGVAPAQAAFNVSVSEVSSSAAGGLTLYTYTVMDLATSTDNLGAFDLTVPTDANLSSFSMPTGFINLYTAGDVDLSFQSTDPSTDLTPGQSAIFSFLSPDKPGLTTYAFTDFNTGDTATGSVIGPAAVPEPASFMMVGMGLVFVGARINRLRLRKQTA